MYKKYSKIQAQRIVFPWIVIREKMTDLMPSIVSIITIKKS